MIFFFKLPSTNTNSVVVFNSAELIRITDPVTLSVVGCMECRTCPAGSGSNVTCGGSVTANIGVPCVPCVTEIDFSTGNSVNGRGRCTECGPNRAVMRKCTATAGTQRGECDKGYHLSGWTGFCEQQVAVTGISHLTVASSPSPTPTYEKDSKKSAGWCSRYFLQEWKVFGGGGQKGFPCKIHRLSIFCLVLFWEDFYISPLM